MTALTFTIPAAAYDSASAIMRALDRDVGGHLSFGQRTRLDDEGNEVVPDTYSTSMPCCEDCGARARDPVALHAYVVAQYAARWADLPVPTLEECEVF